LLFELSVELFAINRLVKERTGSQILVNCV